VRELHEVVEEADRAAPERGEEHRQPLQRVARDREEADRRREQDQQAAHRRRAGLREVVLRAFFADVLAELVAPQERDEARTDEDRRDQRDQRRDQDARHRAGTPASASATSSRPTDREPLTSTASPGRTTSRAHTSASAASAAQQSGS